MENIGNLVKALERLAQFDINMQLSTAMSLLYVARFQDRDGGVTTSDLTNWLGLSTASASRNSYYWADGTKDMPNSGYNLITVVPDPVDRRRRQLRLTPRGEAFIRQLDEQFSTQSTRV